MLYYPDFFVPRDLEHAMELVLTKEGGTTEARWQGETQWTLRMLDTFTQINKNSVVLDWGCGVGRLSRAIIEAWGCKVVGVDLQPRMLELATDYVGHSNFHPIPLSEAAQTLGRNQFSHVLAVWVFQHSTALHSEIPLVYRSLSPGGSLFVVENVTKAVPTAESFYDDGIPTEKVLDETGFKTQAAGKIPEHVTTTRVHHNSWWKLLTRPVQSTSVEYDVHH
jgi:ubiquinone/menaquinone biosynthesis C-methylase UbiE